MLALIAVIIAAILLLPSCGSRGGKAEADTESTTLVKAGDKAPDFTVEMFDGTKTSLAELKGKVVLLNFWATWCPPCRVEIPELIKTSKAYADKGVVIISLSVDEDSAPVLPFVKKWAWTIRSIWPGGTSPGLIRSAAFRITLFTPRTARWFFPSRAWPTKACSKWLSTSF